MSGNFVPLCTAERCQEISQGYAFFAYPWNDVSNENRTLKGCRGFLPPFQGGTPGIAVNQGLGLRPNPWLISRHPFGVQAMSFETETS